MLYVGSHTHDCSAIGTFGQLPRVSGSYSGQIGDQRSWHHLLAEQTSNGKMLDWFPNTAFSPNPRENSHLGPRAMVSDGTNIYVGGEFTTVGISDYPDTFPLVGNRGTSPAAAQQGLTVFRPGSGSSNAAPMPVKTAFGQLLPGGKAVFDWLSSWDPDSSSLQYRVYRDGVLKYTTPRRWAHFWQQQVNQFRDSGLSSGAHTYRVEAVDEDGNVTSSQNFVVDHLAKGTQATVLAQNPNTYWRLNDTSGNVVPDTSNHNNKGTYSGGMNRGISGAVPANNAIHLGTDGAVLSNGKAITGPNTFAVAMFFRTTTKTGGRLIGFSSTQSHTSLSFDRMVYMADSGQLLFGTYDKTSSTPLAYLWSPLSYNDGGWHYVVAEMDQTNGMRMYVDGNLVARNGARTKGQAMQGWWRVGLDNMGTWALHPTNKGALPADIDEVSIYPNPVNPQGMRNAMTAK